MVFPVLSGRSARRRLLEFLDPVVDDLHRHAASSSRPQIWSCCRRSRPAPPTDVPGRHHQSRSAVAAREHSPARQDQQKHLALEVVYFIWLISKPSGVKAMTLLVALMSLPLTVGSTNLSSDLSSRPILVCDASKISQQVVNNIEQVALRSIIETIRRSSKYTKTADFCSHSNTGRGTPSWSSVTSNCSA